MRPLLVGRTYYSESRPDDFQNKLARLASCLQFMNAGIESAQKNPFERLQGILLAPEYYFTPRENEIVLKYAISEEDKRRIEEQLVAYSRKYPKILIMAGSIAWHRPRNRQPVAYEAYKESKLARGLQPLSQEDRQVRIESGSNKFEEFTKTVGEFKIGDKAEPLPFKDDVDKPDIVKNSAYGYLNGERVLKYNKIAMVQETLGLESSAVFFPGMLRKPIEEWSPKYNLPGHSLGAPITMGIEICADHPTGIGRKFGWFGNVDLHVIMSASCSNEDFGCKPGGFAIHSSTSQVGDGVFQKTGDDVKRVEDTDVNLDKTNYHVLSWT
ncbi:MAG TPA: hypothetical protein VF516_46600, partial [Kofleriaceae bacterium]